MLGLVELPGRGKHDADVREEHRLRREIARAPGDLEPFLGERTRPVDVTLRQDGQAQEAERDRDYYVVSQRPMDGQARLDEPTHRLVVALRAGEACDPHCALARAAFEPERDRPAAAPGAREPSVSDPRSCQ